MTWHFDPSGESFDAYDPSGTKFKTGESFSGSWTPPAPSGFYTVAAQHLTDAPDTSTALAWAGELIADDIEEGTPS